MANISGNPVWKDYPDTTTLIDAEALNNLEVALNNAATTAEWGKITGVPTAFPPSAHAASHGEGGSDPITAESIGGYTLHRTTHPGHADNAPIGAVWVAGTDMTTANGYPSVATDPSFLETTVGLDDSYLLQRLTDRYAETVYQRSYYAGVWRPWRYISTTTA